MFEQIVSQRIKISNENLKNNATIKLNELQDLISSFRNNMIGRMQELFDSYGVNYNINDLERIIDEDFIPNLRSNIITQFRNDFQTLSKFNNLAGTSLIAISRMDVSNSEKLEQNEILYKKMDEASTVYSQSSVELIDTFNSTFQSILRTFPLYEKQELVEGIKQYLQGEKETLTSQVKSSRNDIIKTNLELDVELRNYLEKNTNLTSSIVQNEAVNETEKKDDIKESQANVEEKRNDVKKIKLSECDLNEGYYHFTNSNNIESIFEQGLIPKVGTASQMVNDRPNVSISKGGKGVFGIVNSFIFKFSKLKINEIPEDFKKYFKDIQDFASEEIISRESVCNAIKNKLKDEVYIYINADEKLVSNARIGGLSGFDINLPTGIDSSRLNVITDENGNILSSYDVVSYMFEKVKNNNIWREFNDDLFYMMEMDNLVKEQETTIEHNNDTNLNKTVDINTQSVSPNTTIIEEQLSTKKQTKQDDSMIKESERKLEERINSKDEQSNSRILDDGTIENMNYNPNNVTQNKEKSISLSSKVIQDLLLVESTKRGIDGNVWNDIGIMAADTDTQLTQLSNHTQTMIESILSNNNIQFDINLIKNTCTILDQELKEINNNLSANMIKTFEKINNDSLDSIAKTFNRPAEIKEMDIEQCKKVYSESTNLSLFKLNCKQQYQQVINQICSLTGITQNNPIYNELITNINNLRKQSETVFYNMYSSFSHNNAMFMDKAISSMVLAQQTMVDMQQDLSQEQVSRLLDYYYEDYEKNQTEVQGYAR